MYVYDSWENPLLATYPYTFNNYSLQSCSNIDIINQCQTQQLRNNDNLWNLQKIIDCCCQQNLTSLTQQNEIQTNEKIKEESENKEFKSIKDYMNKEFLYESELKKIEKEFKFELNEFKNFNKNNKLYDIINNIVDRVKLQDSNDYIEDIVYYSYLKQLSVYIHKGMNVHIYNCEIKEMESKKVINICNTILKQKFPEYQQFYDKYKNRIVKDNVYEDLSYYEKILKEVE